MSKIIKAKIQVISWRQSQFVSEKQYKRKVYSFILAEVLIALTILVLFLGLIIDTPFLVTKKTFSRLRELELARLSQIELINTKIKLFEEGIPDKMGPFGSPTVLDLYGEKIKQQISLSVKETDIRDKAGLITVDIVYENLNKTKIPFSKNFTKKGNALIFEYKIFTKDLKNHASKTQD